eukprot:1159015-Pelagomonas_calceolata.AAC.2
MLALEVDTLKLTRLVKKLAANRQWEGERNLVCPDMRGADQDVNRRSQEQKGAASYIPCTKTSSETCTGARHSLMYWRTYTICQSWLCCGKKPHSNFESKQGCRHGAPLRKPGLPEPHQTQGTSRQN